MYRPFGTFPSATFSKHGTQITLRTDAQVSPRTAAQVPLRKSRCASPAAQVPLRKSRCASP
ncbi:MAG: hypothetical protein JXA28_07025, partial [Bacteroidetes bacterium]|nr:hypothetical protein [Bacteroidota bacterium]